MFKKVRKVFRIIGVFAIICSMSVFAFVYPTKVEAASATIASSVTSDYGSPYMYFTFSVSYSRSGNTVTVTPSCSARLQYSNSSFGIGLGMTCGIAVGSSGWKTWTLKGTSSSWSGTTTHTTSGSSFSVSVSNTTTSLATQVRVTRSDSVGGNSGKLSARSGSSISFSANTSYAVTYNANGGSGAPASQTKWNSVALTLSSGIPTKEGYNFVGWNTSSTATTATYQPGASYTGNAALSLYAIWSKTITLKYDTNGGTGDFGSNSVTVYNNTTSSAFTVSSTAPTRTGFIFQGWNTDKNAGTALYSSGDSVTLSKSTTLYAIWLPDTCDPFLDIT